MHTFSPMLQILKQHKSFFHLHEQRFSCIPPNMSYKLIRGAAVPLQQVQLSTNQPQQHPGEEHLREAGPGQLHEAKWNRATAFMRGNAGENQLG